MKSLEITRTTLKQLISDKDALIASQEERLQSLVKTHKTITTDTMELDEARKVIIQKDAEINHHKNDIEKLNMVTHEWSKEFEDLKKKYEAENTHRKILEKRIEDQTVIASKAELAFNSESELVQAKDEIIENLKTILVLRKDLNHEQSTTEDALLRLEDSKNGIKKTCKFIEVHATNGAILNGLLL